MRRALVLALTALACAAPAVAQGASMPVEFSGGASEPSLAFNLLGEPAAVWADGEERILGAAESLAGQEWSHPVLLARHGFEPALAGAGGATVAVWAGNSGIEVARWLGGGSWKALRPAPGSKGAWAPELAIDDEGTATVVWRERHRPHSRIEVATLTLGGTWSKARALSARDQEAFAPQVAVDPAGAAAVVWRSRIKGVGSRRGRSVIEASTAGPSDKWSRSAELSVPGENAIAPGVAIDAAGEAVAVWDRFDGEHQIIQATAHPADGSWTPPRDLSAPGRNGEEPQVAVTPGGEALAVWERFDGRVDAIQAATRTPGGAWSGPRNVSTREHSAYEPQVASGADGSARGVWIESSLPGGVAETSVRAGPGAWSAPTAISNGRGSREEPAIALDPEGRTIVGWGGETLAIAAEFP